MSQENVELVRRGFEALNRRDIGAMDALVTDESELHTALAGTEGRVFRGHQGIRDYFAWFADAFEEFGFALEEIIDAGGDRVVVLYTMTARGRKSGITLDQRGGIVINVAGEHLGRMDSYLEPAEALEAAGLSE
jgi:ketosteroid isomerase-like protein